MKKLILVVLFCASATALFSQAKKPVIMVMPSEAWMNTMGYVTAMDNQGVIENQPDYNRAVTTDTDLLLAISKINELMIDRGFPLKDLAATLRSLRTEAAEDAVTMSSDGDDLAESLLDRIRRVAKADIIMELTYTVNSLGGPKKSLTVNLRGLDAYTNKQVATMAGTGDPSFSSEMPILIEEFLVERIDQFNDQLTKHFDDIFENGREVTLLCRAWSGSDVNLETEFDGEELSFIIEDWVADNTVQGRFSTTDVSENRMVLEQVRIPLENARGRALDTRAWANELRKELASKYNIDAKLSIRGLGNAIITLGGK